MENNDKITYELITQTIFLENALKLSKSQLAFEKILQIREHIAELKKLPPTKQRSFDLKDAKIILDKYISISKNCEKYNTEITKIFSQNKTKILGYVEEKTDLFFDLSKILLQNINAENQIVCILQEDSQGEIVVKNKKYKLITKNNDTRIQGDLLA